MRIAIVNQPFDGILPPAQNSIGIWSYETARRQADRHEITVYGPYIDSVRRRGDGRRVSDQGVSYRFMVAGPDRAWSKLGRLWDRVMGQQRPIYASPLYYIEYSLQVALQVRRRRPDIIHIHNLTGFVPLFRLLNRRARIVLHMNCEWLSQLDERRMSKRISQVDAVFGSSNHITGLIQRRFPEYADRCHTVYNGVDPDAFGADRDHVRDERSGPVLAFVGRISPEKGLHDLLDAMAIVKEHHPRVRLDVIGPEGALPKSFIVDVTDDELVAGLAQFYEREYKEILDERVQGGLAEHVRFLGAMPHSEVVSHIVDADLLANPSYSESFGMSLVEALACETPVVATRVGGMPEIVGDDAGLLVERDDPRGLADAIVRLLDDAALRARMGAAGRRRIETVFAWARVAERAEEIYATLASGPAIRS